VSAGVAWHGSHSAQPQACQAPAVALTERSTNCASAGLLGRQPIADITQVLSADTFVRWGDMRAAEGCSAQ